MLFHPKEKHSNTGSSKIRFPVSSDLFVVSECSNLKHYPEYMENYYLIPNYYCELDILGISIEMLMFQCRDV